MPTVVLAPALARWLTAEPGVGVGERRLAVEGTTLRGIFDHLFAEFPQLRSYVLDERGALRHHVVAFLDGVAIADKQLLNEPVAANSEIYLFQALSGG